jgi:hypothetical protein
LAQEIAALNPIRHSDETKQVQDDAIQAGIRGTSRASIVGHCQATQQRHGSCGHTPLRMAAFSNLRASDATLPWIARPA